MRVPDVAIVSLQRLPGGAHVQSRNAHRLFPLGLWCRSYWQAGPLPQLALRIAALFDSMQAIRSFQDLTNDLSPSSWSRAASASMSMPALAKAAKTISQSPSFTASVALTSPWSPKALRVPSGMVLTVKGAASALT